jgi:Ca-activated chloride channel family protein
VRLGIVSFAATAAVVQTVTDKRDDLLAAVDRFELQRGTATGNGLLMALAQLLPDAGIDLETNTYNYGYSPYGYGGDDGASLERKRSARKAEKNFVAVAPGSYTGGGIVLLSDGRRTVGPDPLEAARMAADRGVRVFTVGFGSKNPNPADLQGMSFFAMLDEETLKGIASITGGEYFYAGTAEDLKKVYASLRSKFALEAKETEVSALFGAAAVLLLVLAGGLSLLWFQR